ncbi:MAG: riboflavin synthase [Oscillatoriales cyanobacterium]|jgi:riboflavin synthase|nr:MAG: riboflavin synthase [Oscillatoriales cyanobacterium]
MFTGLVRAIATIERFDQEQIELHYRGGDIDAIRHDLEIGDSVAVDGVCLTVERCLPQGFVAAVSPETLDRSTLGQSLNDLRNGRRHVNLEPSLRAGSKIGGHFVTGHVDGLGSLVSSELNQNSWEMRFALAIDRDERSATIARYIVPKGSIAINGISLTIAQCDPRGQWFEVAVIPHTYAETNLHELQPGALVNLEADILGKYVERLLDRTHRSSNDAQAVSESDISIDFLQEHGYA